MQSEAVKRRHFINNILGDIQYRGNFAYLEATHDQTLVVAGLDLQRGVESA